MSELGDLLRALGNATPVQQTQYFSNQSPVANSAELERILALPRRTANALDHVDIQVVSNKYRRPNGTMLLRPIQAWALEEARTQRGLIAPMAVGGGKTLVSLLLPRAMDVSTSVLFVPAALKRQLQNNYDEYLQHWVLPNLYDYKFDTTVKNMLYVFSYDELSSPKKFDLLSRINPDLLICDEAHNLKALSAARTKRLLRYFKARPTTLFCAMSGTLISRSIMDFGHLAPLALRERTPTPLTYPVRVEWASALDPGLERAPPGELMRFCRPGEDVRVGFRRRLTETHGVVASPPEIFPVSLNIFKRKPTLDDETQGVMLGVRKTWSLPTGENFDSALSYWRAMTQLACGFYYRWIWPNGEPEDVRREWMDARREWNSEVRDYLQKRASAGMDSPGLLAEAAASGKWASAAWARWAAVKDSATPATEPVWISDCIVQEAVQWGRNNVGIIWYAHDAFGQAVAKAGGFPLCGGGHDTGIEKEDGSRTIVASIDAHGTGKQLHMFSRALVTTPPGSNEGWEQLLGRLHRPGQVADEVNFDVYQHTIELQEAFTRARDEAPFVAGVLDVRPRLTYATII